MHPFGAFPVAYLAWFGLGMIDFIDLPDTTFFGVFSSLPADISTYVIAGYVAYLIGGALALAIDHNKLAAPAEVDRAAWTPKRLRAAWVGLVLLFFASISLLLMLIGVPVLSADVGVARLAVSRHGAILTVAVVSGWSIVAIGSNLLLTHSARFVGGAAVTLAILVACLAAFGLLGSRGFVVEPLLVVLCLSSLRFRRVGWLSLGTAATVLFVGVSVAGYLRDRTITQDATFDLLAQGGLSAGWMPLIYAYTYVRQTVYAFSAIVSLIPATAGYHFGALSVSPLITLLPGHQPAPDQYFRALLGFDFEGGGVPATLLGTLYADGGLLAIVLGIGFFAFVLGSLYRNTVRGRDQALTPVLYAWVWHLAAFSIYANLFPYLHALAVPSLCALFAYYAVGNRRWRGALFRSTPAPHSSLSTNP